MAYKEPLVPKILVRARLAQAATDNSTSLISFSLVDFGSQYLQTGSPPTEFVCPWAGIYVVQITSWCCGHGSGELRCTSTRVATTVYDQDWLAPSGCFTAGADFIVPNSVAGDVITLQANENTTATTVTSITDPTSQGQGNCTIYFYPS